MLKGIDNIVILSGGSGNDAILQALFDMGYTDKNIRIIVNAYDDGKSTGICREVTGTLGVSDIRKNHSKIHRMKYKEEANEYLMKLYEERVRVDKDFRLGHQLFDVLIKAFMGNIKSKDEYDNFNVMNIIYSQLYSQKGYEHTNKMMSEKFLGLEDVVKLNSFDNIKIVASTKSGHVITDEGDIVEWKNENDPIKDIHYVGKSFYGLNEEAIEIIEDADLIIISTGTFWSSIYPTLDYLDFYKYINNSRVDKLWIMNSEEDKDTYGVSSVDFYRILKNMGLDLDDIFIVLNEDASYRLKHQTNEMTNVFRFSLGNKSGRNDPVKVKAALETIYG